MRRLLKIFQGKIHASKEPSCWPRIAPRGPATVKGFDGTAFLTILTGTLFSNGNLPKTRGRSFVCPYDCGHAVRLNNESRAAAREAEFMDPRYQIKCGGL